VAAITHGVATRKLRIVRRPEIGQKWSHTSAGYRVEVETRDTGVWPQLNSRCSSIGVRQ
jgi:hypothetical protein